MGMSIFDSHRESVTAVREIVRKARGNASPVAPDIAEFLGFKPGTLKVCKPTKDDVKPPTDECPWWQVTYRFLVDEEKK